MCKEHVAIIPSEISYTAYNSNYRYNLYVLKAMSSVKV